MFIRIFQIVSLVTIASQFSTLADEYAVVLQRSYRKNMVTNETFIIANETASGYMGSAPKQTKESITLTCQVTVKALNAGRWTQLIVTPNALKTSPKALDKGFSCVNVPIKVCRAPRSLTFKRLDGKPLKDFDKEILSRFFVPPNVQSQDDLFGTAKRVAIGDSWPVSQVKAANLLSAVSGGLFSCKATDASGAISLVKVWKTLKTRILQVSGTLHFKAIKAKGPIADALTQPAIAANFKLTFQLPSDASLPAFKTEGLFTWQANGIRKGKTQKEFIVAGQLKRTHLVSIVSNGDEHTKTTTPSETKK